jgi:hypothetical protein
VTSADTAASAESVDGAEERQNTDNAECSRVEVAGTSAREVSSAGDPTVSVRGAASTRASVRGAEPGPGAVKEEALVTESARAEYAASAGLEPAQRTDSAAECTNERAQSDSAENECTEARACMNRVRVAEAKARRLEQTVQRQQVQLETQQTQLQEVMARMVQLEEQMQRGRECFYDTESDKGSAQAEVQRTKTQDGLGNERKLVPDVRTRQIPASSGEQISPQQTVRKAERPRAREVKRRKLGEAVQPRARGKEHVVQSRRTNTSPGDAAMAAAGESGAWRKQGQPRRPSSQGGGATGWNERHVRAAKMAKEQHVRAAKMAKARAAQRAAAARRAAERAWLARERAQGRDQKAAYARWEERRKVWLRREARKAARKRKNPRDCNVRMQGAAVAEEQTAAMKDTVAGGDLTASAADEQTAAVEDTKPGGVSFANASEPTAKTEAEGVGI